MIATEEMTEAVWAWAALGGSLIWMFTSIGLAIYAKIGKARREQWLAWRELTEDDAEES